MHRLAALVFSKGVTANKGNYYNNLVAVEASRQEEAELRLGNIVQFFKLIGVVFAFKSNFVVGYINSKFQSPTKNIGKLVFRVELKSESTSTGFDLGFLYTQ
jgi:hypothetical protein